MVYVYNTVGTCSRQIKLDIEDGILKDVQFLGGCSGNLQGISKLVQGQPVADVMNKLKGIDCHGKGTSCPDQLSQALRAILEQHS